jgi:hypothetical protein
MAAIAASVIAVSVMTTSVETILVMCISVIAILVKPILDGSGVCISDCSFDDDHVSGDDIGDG